MAQACIDRLVGKVLSKDDTPAGELKNSLRKLRITLTGGDR
jgi:hypothetical protein